MGVTATKLADFATLPTITLEMFGARGNNVTADTAAMAEALAWAAAKGGGHLELRAGRTYKFNQPQTYQAGTVPLTISAHGAKVEYSGAGVMLTIDGATDMTGCRVQGGHWSNVGAGTHGFLLVDAERCFIGHGARIGGFTTTCIELRNLNTWCEQNVISGANLYGGSHAILFTPASVSGGGGTESFARTRVTDSTIGGGTVGQPLIYCRGGVYDSTFDHLGGNIIDGAHVMNVQDQMGGTWINNFGFERPSTAQTSYGFTVGAFTGSAPWVGPAMDFRTSILYSDQTPARWPGRGWFYGSGNLYLENSAYTVPMRWGSHYLWIDATGDVRIHTAAPTTDLDGTVLGTQS